MKLLKGGLINVLYRIVRNIFNGCNCWLCIVLWVNENVQGGKIMVSMQQAIREEWTREEYEKYLERREEE